MGYGPFRLYDHVQGSSVASFWLKRAARDLRERDPVDAMADAETLVDICKERLDAMGFPKEDTDGDREQ